MFKPPQLILMLAVSLLHALGYGKSPEQVFSEVAPSITVVFSVEKEEKDSGFGTGVVVAPDTVATNCHIFKAPTDIVVLYRR